MRRRQTMRGGWRQILLALRDQRGVITDGVTPLNAANVPHKAGDDTLTGAYAFSQPVGTAGGLNYSENGDFEIWNAGTSAAPTAWTLTGAGATVAQDLTNFRFGVAGVGVTRVGTDCYLGQVVSLISGFGPATAWRNAKVTLGCWVRATVASRARLSINDGIGTSSSSYHTGGSSFEWLTVTRTISASATQVQLRLEVLTGNTTAQFDGAILVRGTAIQEFVPSAAPIPSSNASGVGAYRVLGNTSKNNGATPNTQWDLSADVVVLKNSASQIVVRSAPSTITVDVNSAGPVANGRDQAGAFSASSWVHFYWIWNGTTLAGVASAVAPPTGPTLPSGYTHWAYAGAVRFNASSQLIKTRMRGSWALYEGGQNVLSAGTATSETAVSVSAAVPPNGLAMLLHARILVVGGSTATDTAKVRVISGTELLLLNNPSTSVGSGNSATLTLPNISQQFYYLIVTTGTAPSLTVDVLGYTLPTGGD